MTVRVGWFDPLSGASGDMLLGAVVGAGADLSDIRAILERLSLDGWDLAVEETTRSGLAATRVIVDTREDGVVRTWGNIRELLLASDLPDAVRARALATFERLAEAEGRIHRRSVERVHFHEVGGLDAIVDIVGVCAGLDLLGLDEIHSAPVAQGVGMTRSEHGLLPIPAPAVLELLAGIPTYGTGVPAELCTPTGAALLAEWVGRWGGLPPLRVERTGYGAGARELDRPNVLRLVIGTAEGQPTAEQALLLETTVDDLPGELVPPVLDALRAAGASDAWARAVVMKKGRPGVEIACVSAPEHGDALRRVLFTETTTLGVRGQIVDRWPLARDFVTVDVAGQPVRLKVGLLEGRVVNVAPEFEDCQRAATATGLPLKEVYARARAAWQPDSDGSGDRSSPPPPPA